MVDFELDWNYHYYMIKTNVLQIKFYSDPGHGWGAVKRKVLDQLGISDQITSYSYMKGETVYLEEDLDLATLVNALKARGIPYSFKEKSVNRYSPIRNYSHYQA